jgi:hypothetical protein
MTFNNTREREREREREEMYGSDLWLFENPKGSSPLSPRLFIYKSLAFKKKRE